MQVSNHWHKSAHAWSQVGPPLRPSQQDIAFYTKAIDSWINKNGTPDVLLLGVTPECFHFPWPIDTQLQAIDKNQNMIDLVWPGSNDQVRCDNWLTCDLDDYSKDIVLCDGGLHLLNLEDQKWLIQRLRRAVRGGGRVIFRLFVPPDQHESITFVLNELIAGQIDNINLLKLRLGMSLLITPDEGVLLADVWRHLNHFAKDFTVLRRQINWPKEQLCQINTYKDSADRYYFVSVKYVVKLFCFEVGGFSLQHVYYPTYSLGERCPVIIFERDYGG